MEIKMEIKFFQAECGDASHIRFLGNDNKYHNVFIDSGYERTFRHILEEEIQNIIGNNEAIDLWIISHIHDDHIGGVLKYISTIKDGEYSDIVNKYLYNPPRIYEFERSFNSSSEFVSISQGDILYEYLKSTNKLLNFDITNVVESIELYGLTLTILSPTTNKLQTLRAKYHLASKSFEKEEDIEISEAVTPKQNDYKSLINNFNLDGWIEDDSVENGSSISVLAEFKNKKILWLADSHPSDVVISLKELGFNNHNKLACDWVKVAHHGSRGNNNDALYNMINCNNFLFSVNGENKHNLPSKECIARILRNKQRAKNSLYKFYFTYDNQTLRRIFNVEHKGIFKEHNFEVFYSDKRAVIFNL